MEALAGLWTQAFLVQRLLQLGLEEQSKGNAETKQSKGNSETEQGEGNSETEQGKGDSETEQGEAGLYLHAWVPPWLPLRMAKVGQMVHSSKGRRWCRPTKSTDWSSRGWSRLSMVFSAGCLVRVSGQPR